MRQDAAPRGFLTGSRIEGELTPPGSKSQAQRALVAASLCGGDTTLARLPDGDDVHAALGLVEAVGARVERVEPGGVRITGLPPGAGRGLRPASPVQVGESGTLARFATAALGLCASPRDAVTIVARGSLLGRRSEPLFAALERAGVRILKQSAPGSWPVELLPSTPSGEILLEHPVSSQEVSGLLIALAAWPDGIELVVRGVIPSRPYLGITRAVLQEFGVEVGETIEGERTTFTLPGVLREPTLVQVIEPDASSAAVALAAACLSGGELCVPGLSLASAQGDVRIVEHLAAFGCAARGESSALVARGFPSRGAELDLSGEPDLAPVLAAVAAAAALSAGAASTLHGLSTLAGKESDRIAVLARGFASLGFATSRGRDFLRIAAPAGGVRGATLDPGGDHRMAFAFALASLFVDDVRVANPGCVAKSWAGFWEDLARAGARVERLRL